MPFEDDLLLLGVDLGDRPALAVVDLCLAVVDAGDDLIAGGEARLAHFDLLGAELPRLAPHRSRQLVQALHLDVSLRDHHRVLAALEGLLPVADHRLAAGLGVGGDRHPLLGDVETERLASLALADALRRLAVELVAVADHLVEVDRLAALGERAEQAAGLDLPQLLGVADQDQLRFGSLGVGDETGEGRRVDHPRLVDQQHRSLPQAIAALVLGAVELDQQAGDDRRRQALVAQHVRRAPGRRRGAQLDPRLRPALAPRRRSR